MAYCLGLLFPFQLWPKSSAACGLFVSLFEINFYKRERKREREKKRENKVGKGCPKCSFDLFSKKFFLLNIKVFSFCFHH